MGLTFQISKQTPFEAQRVDKIGTFFMVSDFKYLKACPAEDRNRGPFILLGNLKLFDWLWPAIIAENNRDFPPPATTDGPLGSNVISHEVKFVIDTSASLTPIWKPSRVFNLNTTGIFLNASRERVQDLIITLGHQIQSHQNM